MFSPPTLTGTFWSWSPQGTLAEHHRPSGRNDGSSPSPSSGGRKTWPTPLLLPAPPHHIHGGPCAPRPHVQARFHCPRERPPTDTGAHTPAGLCPYKAGPWAESPQVLEGNSRAPGGHVPLALQTSGPKRRTQVRWATEESSKIGDNKLQLAGQIPPAYCLCAACELSTRF